MRPDIYSLQEGGERAAREAAALQALSIKTRSE